MPTMPMKIRSFSISSGDGFEGTRSTLFVANPRVLRPRFAISSTRSSMDLTLSSESGRISVPSKYDLLKESKMSGAPLTKATVSPFAQGPHSTSGQCKVVMHFLAESNGISPTRGKSDSTVALSLLPLAARVTSAPSVGSPTTDHIVVTPPAVCPSSSIMEASLQPAATSSSLKSSTSASTLSSFSINSP